MGVTGSLLAAVGAGFSLTGGVLAFHSWPVAAPSRADAVLHVTPPASERQRAEPLALPAAPAAQAGVSAPAGPVFGVARGTAPSVERRRTTTRVPATPTPAPVAVSAPSQQPANTPAPAPAVGPASVTTPVADAVRTTSRGVARSVRGAAQSAAHAAAPAPAAAHAVANAGEQAAATVEAGGQAVADFVRAIH